jgi:GrpB-like predicted nucleotidyltransferase (UPF0157 family)
METPVKPLRGMEIIRKLLDVKQQAQREFEEALQNDPEVRAVYERLEKKLTDRRGHQSV